MCRTLKENPHAGGISGVDIEHFRGDEDIDRWLRLREEAFAGAVPAVRPWTQADFRRELIEQHWWRPQHLWLASSLAEDRPIGTVTLAMRGRGETARPVVHWLAVLPSWRRRGVARLLMSTLEATCWGQGQREVRLETHTGWIQAVRFYEALGYRPCSRLG